MSLITLKKKLCLILPGGDDDESAVDTEDELQR